MSSAQVMSMASSAGAGWDTVASGTSSWTRAQFERLPLIDRVRLLASGELSFSRAGQAVSSREALRTL
jgi:hypothetical protein